MSKVSDSFEMSQTPGDELKWVRNAAEEDTVALASQRGMVVCVGCSEDKVCFSLRCFGSSLITVELHRYLFVFGTFVEKFYLC